MEIKKGIAVSPGIVIAPAVVLETQDIQVRRRTITSDRVGHEQQLVEQAFEGARKDLTVLSEQMSRSFGKQTADIFQFHLGLLGDPKLKARIDETIASRMYTAAFATHFVLRSYQKRFRNMPRHFAERMKDIYDIERRLLHEILGLATKELEDIEGEAIVIAHDLTPSQVANFDRTKILGFCTEAGGQTSHAAILARQLEIPAIVGLPDVVNEVCGGDVLILDGSHGVLTIRPDQDALTEAQELRLERARLEHALDEIRDLPAVTRDGVEVRLLANIEFPQEAAVGLERGADGVGLYRTEFVFLQRKADPSEDEQYEIYKQALEAAGGKPTVIRTFDLGADKYIPHHYPDSERNPFLGLRSIRYSLQFREMFIAQLRAILRASVHGKCRIMLPLITKVMELRQGRMLLGYVMEDLEEDGIPFDRDIPLGIMVETPAAAINAYTLARECDFFSIGTNDLVQYTCAVDRSNERVAHLYTPSEPAVIMLVRDVIRAAKRAGIECSLCGEMAGEPIYTPLLLGLGLRSFSMAPGNLMRVKQVIRKVSIEYCEKVARKVRSLDSDRLVTNYLREEVRKIVPGAV
jgi:phosphotransferase system enzyme I (PtsI)